MHSEDYYKNMFIQKFKDVERCYKELSNYSLIQTSNSLRYLLYDSPPLLDILNREKKLPIIFTVDNHSSFSKSEIASAIILWKEINPIFDADSLDLKKGAFLKWECLYFLGKSITILDIMQFYAYARGGIHLDKGQEKFEPLRQAFETIKVNHVTAIDHTMRGIIQVVFKTLAKFKQQLFY